MISRRLSHTPSSVLPQHLHNEVISSKLLSVPTRCQRHLSQLQTKAAWLHVAAAAAAAAAAITNVLVDLICETCACTSSGMHPVAVSDQA